MDESGDAVSPPPSGSGEITEPTFLTGNKWFIQINGSNKRPMLISSAFAPNTTENNCCCCPGGSLWFHSRNVTRGDCWLFIMQHRHTHTHHTHTHTHTHTNIHTASITEQRPLLSRPINVKFSSVFVCKLAGLRKNYRMEFTLCNIVFFNILIGLTENCVWILGVGINECEQFWSIHPYFLFFRVTLSKSKFKRRSSGFMGVWPWTCNLELPPICCWETQCGL